jgi:hypothetical protein
MTSTITTASHADAINRVGQRLLDRNAAIGRAIAERIVDEVPAYGAAVPELLADLLAGATEAADVLARAMAEGRQPRREQLAGVRELGARRVHQGVTLESFLHAYRAALLAYWDACAQEAAVLAISPDAALALARFALEAMDLITSQASSGYLREEAHVRTRTGREARDLVERLIGGQLTDLHRRQPAAPRLDPDGPLVTIVGRIDASACDASDALAMARDLVSEHLTAGRASPLVVVRQGEIVAICTDTPALDRRAALEAARQAGQVAWGLEARFGLSTPGSGFTGIPQGYGEATLAVSYATEARPIVTLDELSSLECALVDADAATRAVIASKGHALLALPPEELALFEQTIRAFAAADLSVAGAAASLAVHPNTVRYRLQRIADATGHDPRTFTGLTELTCILGVAEPTASPGAAGRFGAG